MQTFVLKSSRGLVPLRCRGCWSASALEFVQGNVVASGGLTVLAAGAGLALARTASRYAGEAALRRFVVRAEFDSRDDSYRWMVAWLAAHPSLREGRRFSVATTLRRLGDTLPPEQDACGDDGVFLLPTGLSLLHHGAHWLLAVRERHEDMRSAAGREREGLTLHILGGSKEDLRLLVREARNAYQARERERTAIHVLDEYGNWNRLATRPMRTLASVVLGEGNTDNGGNSVESDSSSIDGGPDQYAGKIVADCRRFLNSEAWYAARGIPYRRGYLLHGPPGTGKTSLVAALAGELRLPVFVVSASSPKLTDESFADGLAAAAPRCLLLLEDVDSAFRDARRTGDAAAGLTFSGLLNALDGVLAQEGRLLFMTTNHPERLDPALVRPGRVDMRIEFTLCSHAQVARYSRQFYGPEHCSPDEADAIAFAAPSRTLSVAQLQAALMQHPDSPTSAVGAVAAIGSPHRP